MLAAMGNLPLKLRHLPFQNSNVSPVLRRRLLHPSCLITKFLASKSGNFLLQYGNNVGHVSPFFTFAKFNKKTLCNYRRGKTVPNESRRFDQGGTEMSRWLSTTGVLNAGFLTWRGYIMRHTVV
jgi:hypothetical protein